MRVRIVFNLKNRGEALPFHHQNLIYSHIEQMLDESPFDFSQFHEFNFSGLKGQTRVGKGGLHYMSAKVTLVLASLNQDFIDTIIRQIFSQPEFQLGELLMEPDAVYKEEKPEFLETPNMEHKYVCISPLVIAAPTANDLTPKKFVHPTEDYFSDLLYESTLKRMARSGRFTKEQLASYYQFQLVPDKQYLEKIKQKEKKFARIYSYTNRGVTKEVRGYTMPFTLYAAPEVHEYIFETGLGELTYMGFGMIDAAKAEFNDRLVEYHPDENYSYQHSPVVHYNKKDSEE